MPKKTRKPRVSKAVKKYVKAVNKNLGETKETYVASAWAPDYNAVSSPQIFDIAQGLTVGTRIGDKIMPHSLQFRFTAWRGNTDTTLRFIVFRWNDLSAGPTTTASFLESATAGTSNFINAPFLLNTADRKRIQVLHDSSYILDDGKQNGVKKIINVRVNTKPIKFSTTAVGGNMYNAIKYLFMSDVAPINAPSVNLHVIGRYKDV